MASRIDRALENLHIFANQAVDYVCLPCTAPEPVYYLDVRVRDAHAGTPVDQARIQVTPAAGPPVFATVQTDDLGDVIIRVNNAGPCR